MNQRCRIIFDFRNHGRIDFWRQFFNGNAKFGSNQAGGIEIDFLVDSGHHAKHHQFFDDFIDFPAKFDRQFFYGKRLTHFDKGRPYRFLLNGCRRRS